MHNGTDKRQEGAWSGTWRPEAARLSCVNGPRWAGQRRGGSSMTSSVRLGPVVLKVSGDPPSGDKILPITGMGKEYNWNRHSWSQTHLPIRYTNPRMVLLGGTSQFTLLASWGWVEPTKKETCLPTGTLLRWVSPHCSCRTLGSAPPDAWPDTMLTPCSFLPVPSAPDHLLFRIPIPGPITGQLCDWPPHQGSPLHWKPVPLRNYDGQRKVPMKLNFYSHKITHLRGKKYVKAWKHRRLPSEYLKDGLYLRAIQTSW